MRIENGILKDVTIPGVKFVVDIIPKGRKRRPGIAMKSQYVTIHNTGCANVPADNFRRSQLDPSQDKEVSWHFTVDEKTIIQHLPITEVAWHAGNKTGNYTSFGIETCERAGAEEIVILFTAELLKMFKWDTQKVRSHKSWSGKQCPWKILPHWDAFIANIKKAMTTDTELEGAVAKIVASGVKIDAKAWSSMDTMNLVYAQPLVEKIGLSLFKATNYMDSIEAMTKHGIIKSPDPWKAKNFKKEWIRQLLINVASYLD